MRSSQIVIAFDGGMGTKAEVDLAKELGCIIIPFSRSKRSAWELMNDPYIYERLNKFSPTYLKKAAAQRATIKDVADLIKIIIQIDRSEKK